MPGWSHKEERRLKMNKEKTDILLAGVGGLGIVTASSLIGMAAIKVGKSVASA